MDPLSSQHGPVKLTCKDVSTRPKSQFADAQSDDACFSSSRVRGRRFPIVGERPEFTPEGSADFSISGSTLTVTLTNTSSQEMLAIGEVLSGLFWDITDPGVILTPDLALIAPGSRLVGVGATGDMDLSSEWGYKSNVEAGSTGAGPLGNHGIGSVGDINFGADTFGPRDRFDTSTNLFLPSSGSLNGVEGGMVGPNVNFGSDGFTSQGPVVQGWDGTDTGPGQMIFTFDITGGTLSDDEITNVQPLFGTDGAPMVIPEPATVIIWSLLGVIGFNVGWWRRRRKGMPEAGVATDAPSVSPSRTHWSRETKSPILQIVERGRSREC